VTVLVDYPEAAVLDFNSCDHVVLKNLTCGHNIEQGYCTGSVILMEYCNNITIEDCRLYGCGTYGVESYDSNQLSVKNTEIYDCSYGLVDLYRTRDARFFSCRMYNSKEFNMFGFNDCSNIIFELCEVSGNESSSDYFSFIQNQSPEEVIFQECTFTKNKYKNFMSGKVKMQNCTISEN